jgi:PTS system mannose-specific IIA component/PTS system mannose-specific IIB component
LAPGEGQEDILKKYEAAIQEMDTDDGVIFLNDLFGGSPYNVACRLAIHHATYGVVAGVNLPMLIEMTGAQVVNEGAGIKEMMSKAVEAGKAGTQMFHASTVEKDEVEDL